MLFYLLIIAAVLVITAVGLTIIWSLKTGIVPMPSLPSERKTVVELIGEYDGIHTITDLGSGWGGMARLLKRELPDRKIIAAEHSPVPYWVSRLRSRIGGLQITHRRCSIFDMLMEEGNAYTAYLSGDAMKKLRGTFERDQPTGCLLVSIAFAMPGWSPENTVYAGGILRTPVYVYRF